MPNIMGKNVKGGYIIGGLAGVAGLAYFYIKHKQSAATAATPATGTTPYGYGYGGYGYQNPPFNEPYIGGEFGYGGAYGYGIGQGYGVGSPYPSVPPQLASTNAAWAQAAEQYLTTTGGYDAGTVAAALGIYITGSTLSAAQQAVVEAAIAFEGYPPNAGANGYPPAMHTNPIAGQGGGGGGAGGGSGKVTVPSITGLSIDNAGVTLSSEGLKIRVISPPVRNHAYTYTILTQMPKAGSQANKNSSVNVTAKKGAKV